MIFVSDLRGISTDQTWDQSCVRSVCGRHWCHLSPLQPAWKPASSSVNLWVVRKSTLRPEACHSDQIKPQLVLAVALQWNPAVTLRCTHTSSSSSSRALLQPVAWAGLKTRIIVAVMELTKQVIRFTCSALDELHLRLFCILIISITRAHRP